MRTEYVVKVLAPQNRDLWLDDEGGITEHFQLAARFASVTEANLWAFQSLPYSFEVQLTKGSIAETVS